jgi:Leucine-rich repeat (LRR) protein
LLQYLNFYNCGIDEIPENLFKNLKNLKKVELGDNKLTHLPKSLFGDNLQLETIRLLRNKLQTIGVDFTKLPKIRTIALKDNVCINEEYSPEFHRSSTITSVQELQLKINSNCI